MFMTNQGQVQDSISRNHTRLAPGLQRQRRTDARVLLDHSHTQTYQAGFQVFLPAENGAGVALLLEMGCTEQRSLAHMHRSGVRRSRTHIYGLARFADGIITRGQFLWDAINYPLSTTSPQIFAKVAD